jgi:3,5-epimerase/4-reductase
LHDLLPVSLDMAKRELTGVYNFTNPGAISHNEILALYKEVRAQALRPAMDSFFLC